MDFHKKDISYPLLNISPNQSVLGIIDSLRKLKCKYKHINMESIWELVCINLEPSWETNLSWTKREQAFSNFIWLRVIAPSKMNCRKDKNVESAIIASFCLNPQYWREEHIWKESIGNIKF